MEKRNKPRVFLSHSKKDEKFINRLYKDLQRSKIDAWLDTEEIRDGKPWLKVIFEDGLPTCDVVIVYFTENSISSKMVSKEIDAALIENMNENSISFLPYVAEEGIRQKLRVDIRTLHCRIWNDENYFEMLTSVISEIWHCYLERNIDKAILKEKYEKEKLLNELLQLKEKNQGTPFSNGEEKDFEYIFNHLNNVTTFEVGLYKKNENHLISLPIKKFNASIPFLTLLMDWMGEGHVSYHDIELCSYFSRRFVEFYEKDYEEYDIKSHNVFGFEKNPLVEMQSFGLLKGISINRELTSKMYRFRYWLGYYNKITQSISKEEFLIAEKLPNKRLNTTASTEPVP